jgi:tetratricopeptide (TPR) repeat protein
LLTHLSSWVGRLKVARGDQERDELRERLRRQNRTPEQIAAAMARKFGDRRRVAWRHAHGWTQQQVADHYNREVKDPNASMTAHRISDFERWPINGAGVKPSVVPTLAVLAKIYATSVSKIVDQYDRQNMSNGELIGIATVDSGVIPQQLPATISNFVGRAYELDILSTQLNRAGEDTGTVVITAVGGTAGIGKTTLVLYWARTYIDQFPDGQLYVDLRGFDPSGTPTPPATAIRSFLNAFHIPADKIPINPDDQAALYRTLVEGRRLVIVLDNARDADQVWPLLPGSPTCLVLVTSRQQLGSLIARNQAVHITLDFMTPAEARQLFTTVLGAERVQAEPDAVEELIQYCVGLPLALNIAAARIMAEPKMSLSTLVSQLREQRQRLDVLSTGDSQLTDIRAVFSWSYTALPSGAARLFCLLGLHPGPDINLYAAASLAGLPEPDTRQLLTALTQAHLLQEHTAGRYQFHDLLRAYAAETAHKYLSSRDSDVALQRLVDFYLRTACVADRLLYPHRPPTTHPEPPKPGYQPHTLADVTEAVAWFNVELPCLLAVQRLAAKRGWHTAVWTLICALAGFQWRHGNLHDSFAVWEAGLTTAEQLGDPSACARAHRRLGLACIQAGRHDDAIGRLYQAVALAEDAGDLLGQAHAYYNLARAWGQHGDDQRALEHATQGLYLFRDLGDQAGEAVTLSQVGRHQVSLGELDTARASCEAALVLHRQHHNRDGEAGTLDSLGYIAYQVGQYDQALNYYQQALALYRELGNHYGEAGTLDGLGYTYHHLGQHDQAIIYFQQSITLYHELGYHYGEADTLTRLGDTHHAIGNVAAAREAWQQALTILKQLGHSDADIVRTKLATLDADPEKPTTEGQLKD